MAGDGRIKRTFQRQNILDGGLLAARLDDQLVTFLDRTRFNASHVAAEIVGYVAGMARYQLHREAERLGLPRKDYIPLTPEEKIVSYADNLISGVAEVPFLKALDRFKTVLGPDHEGVSRFIQQHEEIQGWMK